MGTGQDPESQDSHARPQDTSEILITEEQIIQAMSGQQNQRNTF